MTDPSAPDTPPEGADPRTGPGEAVPATFWATVVAAIRGTRIDLTEAPLNRAIVLLAVPMVLEMVLESVFAVVDIFWVSRLGAEAVAAVGLTEAMLTLIYTVAMGLSIGVMAVVSRRIGEKDPEAAGRAAAQAVILGAVLAGVVGIAGASQAGNLLRLMGGEPDMIAEGVGYTTVMLAGNGTVLLLFLINAAFRGAGDAAIAMRLLWLANGINLILDPLLIFGVGPFPELGVTGAAVATNTGRGIAVLAQLWMLGRGVGMLKVDWAHTRIDLAVMWRLVRLSLAGTFQTFVGTASWIALVRLLSVFGSESVAGYTVGIRIVLFALLPAWGLSNAAATLVGQSLGAGKPDRAEVAVWKAGFLNFLFLGSIGLVFVIFTEPIIGLFALDPVSAAYGVDSLRIVSLGFFFYAYGMVLTQSFNGAGDPWTPTWINVGCFWAFEIPLAWFLAHPMGLGPRGIWIAITVAFSSLAVISGFIFRMGRWKTKEV
jgi:putative MATE family efflux protein